MSWPYIQPHSNRYSVALIFGVFVLGTLSDNDKDVVSTAAKICKTIASYYLDPEVILNKGSRDLGVKVVSAKALKSDDFKNFYFVQFKMETPANGTVYPMFAMNKPFEVGVTIYAMDELALALSGLADGRKTKAAFKSSDQACLLKSLLKLGFIGWFVT